MSQLVEEKWEEWEKMKQKIGQILIVLFVILLCTGGCAKKEKQEVKEQGVNYEALYNTYVRQEVLKAEGVARLDRVGHSLEDSEENSKMINLEYMEREDFGTIGSCIVDLNKDDVPELILAYVDASADNLGELIIEVYTIDNGNVEKVENQEEQLKYEFFYQKCQGNLHIFMREVDGQMKLCVLKAFERSFGTLYYDVLFDVYSMEDGKIVRKIHEEMSEEDYLKQASNIARNVNKEISLGEWFETEFKVGLGESGTGVFAPFDYNLSSKDASIIDVARIQEAREDGYQYFQYYDFTNMRERVLYEEPYKKLIREELLPQLGVASDSFNTWEKLDVDAGECFGEVDAKYLGLVSSFEVDCNQDGIFELLVFYLKQEAVKEANGGEIVKQNLYIDLYTQKNDKAKFVCTVDVLEPVIPWSSVFAYEDTLRASIRNYEDSTYLYIERGCTNEGPVQVSYTVYNLTDLDNIKKVVYYMPIIDGGRLDGELIIPASTSSGSSGEHEFIAKVENEKVEVYFESVEGEPETRYGELKCKTYEEAEKQVALELYDMGYVLDEWMGEETPILSWQYLNEVEPYVCITDSTYLNHYAKAVQQGNSEQQGETGEIEQEEDVMGESVMSDEPETTPQDVVSSQPQDTQLQPSSAQEVENATPKMTANDIYNKLVQYYQLGTVDASGDELVVMEGMFVDENQYETSVNCGVPGNASTSQILYHIMVDARTGEVTQTRVLTDNQVIIYHLY